MKVVPVSKGTTKVSSPVSLPIRGTTKKFLSPKQNSKPYFRMNRAKNIFQTRSEVKVHPMPLTWVGISFVFTQHKPNPSIFRVPRAAVIVMEFVASSWG